MRTSPKSKTPENRSSTPAHDRIMSRGLRGEGLYVSEGGPDAEKHEPT